MGTVRECFMSRIISALPAIVLAIGLASSPACAAGTPDIWYFDADGLLGFWEVPGAHSYTVLGAVSPSSPWSNRWPELTSLLSTRTVAAGVQVPVSQSPMFYRISAYRPTPPPNMALAPPGYFLMGNAPTNDGWEGDLYQGVGIELPRHRVFVDGFYIWKHEVTWDEWVDVGIWTIGRGYGFANTATNRGANYPAVQMPWYDAVKWCNAKSEKESLTPCYYSDTNFTVVYRTGESNLTAEHVNWQADGYRLPTEAEWEYAARGGPEGRRFAWGHTDHITQDLANYATTVPADQYTYDDADYIDESVGYHPEFYDGGGDYAGTAEYFPANGFGIHEMCGNVWEMCWDWYHPESYRVSPEYNPRGIASGEERIMRGGYAKSSAKDVRVAKRDAMPPRNTGNNVGFRVVRRAPVP